MIHPIPHLNGTSKEELVRQVEEAYHTLDDAISALQQMRPHARDYYPRGEEVLKQATDQHGDRMKRLMSVQKELMGMFEELIQ